MNSQLLYQEDVTVLEFDAGVVEVLRLSDERTGVVLDRTYFYPTGGGQEYDTGVIGSASVVDVFKNDQSSNLIHVVQGEVRQGQVRARIDPERRLRHMQHHTAQHLLTQCILRQAGFETVSANINGISPSTLDIATPQISKAELEQAEWMANRIIYENKPVKTYLVSPQELESVPLRRPPKVHENIRIVEIEGFDYSPCGGTHVLHTGSIGVVKVLKAERQNDKTRIHFVAGLQAFEVFRQMFDSVNSTAVGMSISWQDIPQVLARQAEQLALLQKELQLYRQASLRKEAQELAAQAEAHAGFRLVRASFEGRGVTELRTMTDELRQEAGLVAFLSSYDGQKLTLVVTCGEGTGKDARQLLTRNLAKINGRGGGDARLAQGGGVVTAEQHRIFLNNIETD